MHRASYLGKALRVNVNDRSPDLAYGIPVDNPFINQTGAKPEIYAYGLRNPWRCAVDRGDRATGNVAGCA